MQNKPNLLNTQMNVRSLITVDYENKSNWKLGENKPNQSQFSPKIRIISVLNFVNPHKILTTYEILL